jgi:hypothetical protein
MLARESYQIQNIIVNFTNVRKQYNYGIAMISKNDRKTCFASDNYSGICQEALDYINKANTGYDYPYGEDSWTEEACDLFRELFETDCEVFFVYNGTVLFAMNFHILRPMNAVLLNFFQTGQRYFWEQAITVNYLVAA